jgi:hypothetical protein
MYLLQESTFYSDESSVKGSFPRQERTYCFIRLPVPKAVSKLSNPFVCGFFGKNRSSSNHIKSDGERPGRQRQNSFDIAQMSGYVSGAFPTFSAKPETSPHRGFR